MRLPCMVAAEDGPSIYKTRGEAQGHLKEVRGGRGQVYTLPGLYPGCFVERQATREASMD